MGGEGACLVDIRPDLFTNNGPLGYHKARSRNCRTGCIRSTLSNQCVLSPAMVIWNNGFFFLILNEQKAKAICKEAIKA